MFESKDELKGEILGLLDSIRGVTGSGYACVVDRKGIVFESPEPEERGAWALRRLLEERGAALFAIPKGMASGEPMEDVFEGWEHDELLLAFINERIALVVHCPEAEPARQRVLPPLKALADRLFRYNGEWRMDPRGRGFFFGRAKLDLVTIGRTKG